MQEEQRINEHILLYLYENTNSQQIEIGKKIIEKPLEMVKQLLYKQLQSVTTTLENIVLFIKTEKELELIENYYAYCSDLALPFQGVTASNQRTILDLENAIARIRINKKNEPDEYNATEDIASTKRSIYENYRTWFHAYEIHRAYRECNDEPSILSFSHRICGWSDPRYQLTPNFSLELKTNFGYGRSSYFYTKLTYKNVEISPISEWVRYEHAEFMEIVRYSRKQKLEHWAWQDAMEYTKVACNLSRTDENAFVEKYIINECQEMVDGLHVFLNNDKFEFRNTWHEPFFVDKHGHVLIDYRGEKISGALDFIQKIMEFEHITGVQSFINSIKDCNYKLMPMLANELILLESQIIQATEKRKDYEPVYDENYARNNEYANAKEELKLELIKSGQMAWKAIDQNLLNISFKERFKEFEEFLAFYKVVSEKWLHLNQHLSNLNNFKKNISGYQEKIKIFLQHSPLS